ncbi:hypothetical protein IFM53868_10218 [Aspergillus udagawae]|uniref:Retroviral polymerase SH3-like domain-containing protein n=1 Tax=Aspergillus udagawae TaxID=91492 RepID=A0ABQ1BDK4_9EURO|nr:hypothetical protein IFM53868_10218 [Aspergillus udagawae]
MIRVGSAGHGHGPQTYRTGPADGRTGPVATTRRPLWVLGTRADDGVGFLLKRGPVKRWMLVFGWYPGRDQKWERVTFQQVPGLSLLERDGSSSRKLYDALEGVQTELGSTKPQQTIQYVEALRSKMSGRRDSRECSGRHASDYSIRLHFSRGCGSSDEGTSHNCSARAGPGLYHRIFTMTVDRGGSTLGTDIQPSQYNTPYSAWANSPQDLSHIKKFGSVGWMHLHGSAKPIHKLDARAKKVHLIGYVGNHIYRVWNPNSNTVHVTSDVTFDEHTLTLLSVYAKKRPCEL